VLSLQIQLIIESLLVVPYMAWNHWSGEESAQNIRRLGSTQARIFGEEALGTENEACIGAD